jgi:hypothetical protein
MLRVFWACKPEQAKGCAMSKEKLLDLGKNEELTSMVESSVNEALKQSVGSALSDDELNAVVGGDCFLGRNDGCSFWD